jgi:hypothetical protein
MSRIDSWHRKISTGRHFQNGHHNTAQIQYCSISTSWIDSRCQESIRDIIIYPHMKCRWNRTMLNLCSIVVTILKMVTGKKISMSGINSGHHYLPTYQILMISDNVEFLRNTAQIQHCPISTTFHMWIDYDVPNWFLTSKNFYRSPFSKWPPQYRTNSILFDFNVR